MEFSTVVFILPDGQKVEIVIEIGSTMGAAMEAAGLDSREYNDDIYYDQILIGESYHVHLFSKHAPLAETPMAYYSSHYNQVLEETPTTEELKIEELVFLDDIDIPLAQMPVAAPTQPQMGTDQVPPAAELEPKFAVGSWVFCHSMQKVVVISSYSPRTNIYQVVSFTYGGKSFSTYEHEDLLSPIDASRMGKLKESVDKARFEIELVSMTIVDDAPDPQTAFCNVLLNLKEHGRLAEAGWFVAAVDANNIDSIKGYARQCQVVLLSKT